MRNIRIDLQYDGTNYSGWQVQENHKTIQGEIEKALNKIFGIEIRLTGSGRTDSGVHALKQVANFKVDSNIECGNILNAINSNLPYDIRLYACQDVQEDFNARFSAKSREYLYVIYNDSFCPPFLYNYVYHAKQTINEELLKKALNYFVGEHDFASFTTKIQDSKTTIRNVLEVNVEVKHPRIFITIKANGFLRKMVRMCIGACMKVVTNKIEPEMIKEILKIKDRGSHNLPSLSPKGLYLKNVIYDEDERIDNNRSFTSNFHFLLD